MKIVIIGAGVAGLGIGWRLAQAGADVTILERAQPASGATWAAAGLIAPAAEFGEVGNVETVFASDSSRLWPDFAKEVEAEGGISLSFSQNGSLMVACDAEGLSRLDRRGGELLDAQESRRRVPMLSSEIYGALWVPGDAHIDNRALGWGLAAAFRRSGGILAANEAVVGIEHHEGGLIARTPFGHHHADAFLIAAGAWSGMVAEGLPAVTPVKGEMIALAPPPGAVFPAPVVWGEGVYLVPRGGAMLVGATMEETGFDTSLTRGSRDWLHARATRVMPGLAGWTLRDHWAGLRPRSADRLPLLGPTRTPGLYLASGQYRNGILFAPAIAELMRDIILGERGPIPAFDPRRFP